MAIRWKKGEIDSIRKLNKKAERKISRIREQYDFDVPFKVQQPSEFQDRNEYNSYIKSVNYLLDRKTYSFRTNKYGVSLSNYEIETAKQLIEKRNKVKEKEYNEIKRQIAKSGGVTDFTTVGRVKQRKRQLRVEEVIDNEKLYEFRHREFNINKYRSIKDFQADIRSLRKQISGESQQENAQQYKENYIKAIKAVYGGEADEIIVKIQEMSTKQFLNYYYTDAYVSIDFVYSEELEGDKQISSLRNIFK